MNRVAFFISDGTGITAETLGHSLLAQFGSIAFEQITFPYIDTLEKAQNVVDTINLAQEKYQCRPIIFDTIIDKDIRSVIRSSNGFMIDIFSTFLAPLEEELGSASSYSVGKSRAESKSKQYETRIAAVNFALETDDGLKTQHYGDADVILVGVSRSGKTPTCLYLGLQFGLKAANYPITEDDLDHNFRLPNVLQPYKQKIIGLTIESERLSMIRQQRKSNSRYASLPQCELEIESLERTFKRQNIHCINTTKASVEEISTRIIAAAGLKRRVMY